MTAFPAMNRMGMVAYSPDEPAAAPAPAAPAAEPAAADPAPAEPAAAPAEAPPADASLIGDAGKPAEGDAPKDDAAPADEAKPAVVPDAYEIALEGVTVDAAMVEAATPLFKELGLSNDQATKVAGFYAEQLPKITENVATQINQQLADNAAQLRTEWARDALADPELGAGKEVQFRETMGVVAKFRDAFCSPEFVGFLAESGLGNHPEMIRMMAKAGREIGEGSFHTPSGGAKPPGDAVQLFYGDAYAPKT